MHSLLHILYILSILFVRVIHQNQKNNFNQTRKDCLQDNLLFACLQFYKHNRLNILVGNFCSHKQAICSYIPYDLVLFFISWLTGKAFNSIISKSSILGQMV